MDESQIAPALTRIYISMRGTLEATQQLTLAIGAIKAALAERDPTFEDEFSIHFAALQRGELGRQIAQDLAAFDRLVGSLKAGRI